MTFSEKIFYCRRRAGLSQEALAEKLGVSRQAVGKWESGDAAPEMGKLPALARVFGVSIDWLLSDEAPEPEPLPEPEAGDGNREARDTDALADAVEKLPGFLGRLVKRFGWLYGIYQAIGGLVFCLFGGLIKAMGRTAAQMTGDFMNFGAAAGGVAYYDEAGNVMDPAAIPAEVREALNSAMGIQAQPSYGVDRPFDLMGNFVIVIGLIILIAGLALAWYLKRLGRRE